MIQWQVTEQSLKCGVVLHCPSSPNSNQCLASAMQSHQATSRPVYANSSTRNSNREIENYRYRKLGLDKNHQKNKLVYNKMFLK